MVDKIAVTVHAQNRARALAIVRAYNKGRKNPFKELPPKIQSNEDPMIAKVYSIGQDHQKAMLKAAGKKVQEGALVPVIEVAAALFKKADEMEAVLPVGKHHNPITADELRVFAGKLETSDAHLMEDIYSNCCSIIHPYISDTETEPSDRHYLPSSVTDSLEMLLQFWLKHRDEH